MSTHCVWRQDGFGEDHYDTTCGNRFTLMNGCSPRENKMQYCCYCGGLLDEILGIEEYECEEGAS